MIIPRREDAIHKAMMYRLLMGLLDNDHIANSVHFKGGTCAAMLGYLDRFSVDLDFDLKQTAEKSSLAPHLSSIIRTAGMQISKQSTSELFFIVRYHAPQSNRNTLKLSIIDQPVEANEYAVSYLKEIDRYASCQTIETMFANKLVSLIDRYEKYRTIAGRDVYDIHYFFSQGYKYRKEIIEERTKLSTEVYLKKLVSFIKDQVTNRIIQQDLNYLLPFDRFQTIQKTVKTETLVYLTDECARILLSKV